MKVIATTLAAIAIAVAATLYITWPVGHIPTYDAKLHRLAETPLEGYCAGLVFWKSQGAGSKWQTAKCREFYGHDPKYKHYVSLSIAQKFFCKGIQKMGYEDTVASCVTILDTYTIWPTYNGELTDMWSQTRPYPKKSGPQIGI